MYIGDNIPDENQIKVHQIYAQQDLSLEIVNRKSKFNLILSPTLQL